MSDLAARRALKERLPRTWPAFFARHGNFTAAQMAATPALLAGSNVMLCAPTASGKTEAVIAPLVERHCLPDSPCPAILYLTPTKALANDLAGRLSLPLDNMGLSLGLKTRDATTFRLSRPPHILITTPESADALLTSQARLFAQLRAIVLDELHLLDGTPRGDQLRIVLNRIRQVRAYAARKGDAPDAAVQYAALSATLAQPEKVAACYFESAQVIRVEGRRALDAELLPILPDSADELLAYLNTFGARGWRKGLVFCNSRAEVEAYAAAVRDRAPFGGAVYVHYSNIEARRRREIEAQFGAAQAALCFASSTLELGIDIGDIDIVILIGPPGNSSSFLQRIGRGNRRRELTRVACFYRTPLERLLFAALTAAGAETPGTASAPFRLAVAIQQLFSLLKQSPTGAIRLAMLVTLFDGMLTSADLEAILGQLHDLQYLKPGRPGEWRAGTRLNYLVDLQANKYNTRSIHSNIQATEARQVEIRNQFTHQTLARVDAQWLDRPSLTLEGRPVSVTWVDDEAMWITASQEPEAAGRMYYRSARQVLSTELAGRLPAQLGLAPGTSPLIETPVGWLWFHWLGDLYGQALYDMLRAHVPVRPTSNIGLCLLLADEPEAPPTWTEAQVTHHLRDHYQHFEAFLSLGTFNSLLPVALRRRVVVEQFNVVLFLDTLARLRLVRAPEALTDDLQALLTPRAGDSLS
jgi:ATP-dependent Lhr-like helicase